MRRLKLGQVVLGCMVASLVLLSGCGNKSQSEVEQSAPTEDGAMQTEVVEVESVEDLLENIKPDASILIMSGTYNVSDFLESVDAATWNESHPYVQIQTVNDGSEFVIQKVTNLAIKGEGAETTEIITEPRYAAIMNFEDCAQISLEGLTMGHTDTGYCVGNVVNFSACSDITMKDLDLYGCGVYGIGTENGTSDLTMYDSTIRECAYGPYEFYSAKGDYKFYNCNFVDSEGSGYCNEVEDMKLAFYDCTFGYYESASVMYNESIVTENCVFSDDEEWTDEELFEKQLEICGDWRLDGIEVEGAYMSAKQMGEYSSLCIYNNYSATDGGVMWAVDNNFYMDYVDNDIAGVEISVQMLDSDPLGIQGTYVCAEVLDFSEKVIATYVALMEDKETLELRQYYYLDTAPVVSIRYYKRITDDGDPVDSYELLSDDDIMENISTCKEVQELIDMGMAFFIDGETEIVLDGETKHGVAVSFGTNHPEQFVVEEHLAVTSDGNIYRYEVWSDTWSYFGKMDLY